MSLGQQGRAMNATAPIRYVLLGDVCRTTSGGTPSRGNPAYFDGIIPWVKSGELPDGPVADIQETITEAALANSSAKLFPAGTLLIALYGATVGKLGVLTRDAATNQAVCAVFPTSVLEQKYLFWFLRFKRRALIESAIGGAQPNISQGILRNLQVPLPTVDDQRAAVAEIEKQFSRLDEAVANLKRVKANLKRYKAAVLKAAVEGHLVLTEYELQKRDDGSAIFSDPEPKKQKSSGPHSSAELPKGWNWTSPTALAEKKANSICAGPFGTIFKAKDFRSDGVPIIFLRHVAPGIYLTHKPGFMDRTKWHELFQSYSVFGGELLITKLGEPPGACAIYPEGIGAAMVTPDVIKLSVEKAVAVPKYIMYYFNSELGKRYASGAAFGTTRQRLTLSIFKDIPIPLPPLREQQRIVAEVERSLSVLAELETAIATNFSRAERLRQGVLAHAFSTG